MGKSDKSLGMECCPLPPYGLNGVSYLLQCPEKKEFSAKSVYGSCLKDSLKLLFVNKYIIQLVSCSSYFVAGLTFMYAITAFLHRDGIRGRIKIIL